VYRADLVLEEVADQHCRRSSWQAGTLCGHRATAQLDTPPDRRLQKLAGRREKDRV
jgi:hypothetical protein